MSGKLLNQFDFAELNLPILVEKWVKFRANQLFQLILINFFKHTELIIANMDRSWSAYLKHTHRMKTNSC